MMNRVVRITLVWVGVSTVLLLPGECRAYIDPNAGGWLFQLLFPLLVAIGAGWALLRQRISAAIDKLRRRIRLPRE